MKKAFFPTLLLALCLLLSGCSTDTTGTPGQPASTEPASTEPASTEPTSTEPAPAEAPAQLDAAASPETALALASGMFSDRDFQTTWDADKCAYIELNGDSAACTSNAVRISGSTITILDEGTYVVSGTLNNGMLIVNTDKSDKTQIVLNNAAIHSETSAALYILQSDKVFITLPEGTTNTLSNGGSFVAIDDNNIDAALFSKEDVTINGSGTLVVTSPAGHGVVSKDSLTITGGLLDVNCAAHALAGKDDVCIADGSFILVSGKDGIHAENNDDEASGHVYIQRGVFDINAQGDGISAAAQMQLQDGSFTITAGGGSVNGTSASSSGWGSFGGGGKHRSSQSRTTASDTGDESTSMKGIKAGLDLTVNGGVYSINAADDAMHTNASLTVHDGTFDIATGDDGFHADDTLTINGGAIGITESYEGLEGLHVKVNGGNIALTASDDGLNAAGGTDQSGSGGRDTRFGGGRGMFSSSSRGSIVIAGGTLRVTASGDGLDANGTLEITGGHTIVCGPTSGDTATLDYDISGVITGGTFLGSGAAGMAQTFSDSAQGVIALSVGRQNAEQKIVVTDQNGSVVVQHTPELSFAVVILSSPELIKGETYQLTVGETTRNVTAK